MDDNWELKMERVLDGIVATLVDEMQKAASELFPLPPNTTKYHLIRGTVLASITWTRLAQKIMKMLDDVRHEHLLTMRKFAEDYREQL